MINGAVIRVINFWNFPQLYKLDDRIYGGHYSVIEDRRENPGDDFISVLIATADEDNDRLSIEEVMAFVASLLAAGPDTTWHYLNSTLHTLLSMPEVVARLQQQTDRIPDAITEAQRYDYFAHSGGVRFARERARKNFFTRTRANKPS